ncbi:DMT family transporter [Thermodesulfobacteriota bacterium]
MHGEYGMRRYNPWTVLFFAFLFATVVWNILHPPLEALFRGYSLVQWWWILYIAIMGTLLPFGLYMHGIKLIRSTRASITAFLEPITAGVLSSIFLNEMMEGPQIVGGALVIGSVVLLQFDMESKHGSGNTTKRDDG